MEKTGLQEGKNGNISPKLREALTRAMSLCASREYCSDDIRIKLDSWGLNSSDIESVISSLAEENFINDKRYAEAFVKDRYRQNKWGRLKIAAQLRAKRIDPDLIDSALSILDEDDYRRTIRDLLDTHRKNTRAKNQYDLKGKLMRFGLSKGFESHILYDILNEL
jgi:regulatory protein